MPIQAQVPHPQESTPYPPEALPPLVFEQFEGINTSTTRPGVPDKQCYWIDGFMPLDMRNARTLPDLGTTLYNAPGGLTVVFFEFYNLAGVPYMIVFLSDGSAVQVNINTMATTTIMVANTIQTPSILNVGVSQWAQQYLIIVANQTNGYWVWDGSILYGAGTLAPVVTITNVGNGYTSPPAAIVSGGAGISVTIVGVIANGQVTGASVISPGTGYLAGDSVTLSFFGGQTSGTGASVTLTMANMAGGSGASMTVNNFTNTHIVSGVYYWAITGSSMVAAGSGYTQYARVNLTSSQAITNAVANPIISSGSITNVNFTNPGVYATAGAFFPGVTATFIDTGISYVSLASVVAPGSNYSPVPVLTVSGGATVTAQATLKALIVNGSFSSVVVQSGGVYGNTTPVPSVGIVDTPVTATGVVTLMPFAISGTAVTTYQGYVWIVNGNVLYNSAPGSVSDFATSDGGGNKTSASNQLRVGYKRLMPANGFLYTIADSSVDVVSGVQTSGSVITTSYSWLNADPETGSPFPEAVMTWDRGLMMANAYGIHVFYGSQAQKISSMLDGVFNSVVNFSGQQLSLAEMIVFGRKIAIALVPIVDPISQQTVNKLLCWDGKRWFASQQGKTLTYIKHQEINSQITAYGTNGSVVAPIFTTPSTNFTKTIQSRLWDQPGGYQFLKGLSRLWMILQFNNTSAVPVDVTIDNETGAVFGSELSFLPGAITWFNALNPAWVNALGVLVEWVNNINQVVQWFGPIPGDIVVIWFNIFGQEVTWYGNSVQAPAFVVTPPQSIGQQGALVGFTIETTHPDMTLISAQLQPEMAQYRG